MDSDGHVVTLSFSNDSIVDITITGHGGGTICGSKRHDLEGQPHC